MIDEDEQFAKRMRMTQSEDYYRHPTETTPLMEKISAYAPTVHAKMQDLMAEMAVHAVAIYAPKKLEDEWMDSETKAKIHLAVVITYLVKALKAQGAKDAVWEALRGRVKAVTTVLNEMFKYMYAYNIICNLGETARRTLYCWKAHEMLVVYMLEYLNFTAVMNQTPFAWFESGEAGIFAWAVDRYQLVSWSLLPEITNEFRSAIEARTAQRRAEFDALYPKPFARIDPAEVTRAWCTSFLHGMENVKVVERELAALSPAWTEACHIVADAAGQKTLDVNTVPLETLKTVNLDAFAAALYGFLAKRMPLWTQPNAVQAALLKEHRLPAILRVVCAMLQRHNIRIPVWIVEFIAMHKSQEKTQMLRDELRGPILPWDEAVHGGLSG